MNTTNTTNTIKIAAEELTERVLNIPFEGRRKPAERALKRKYEIVEDRDHREGAVTVETPIGEFDLYSRIDRNYGKEPRVLVFLEYVGTIHSGRITYIQTGGITARTETGETYLTMHSYRYGTRDRKIDEDMCTLVDTIWEELIENHKDAVKAVAGKAINEMVAEQIAALETQIEVLKSRVV